MSTLLWSCQLVCLALHREHCKTAGHNFGLLVLLQAAAAERDKMQTMYDELRSRVNPVAVDKEASVGASNPLKIPESDSFERNVTTCAVQSALWSQKWTCMRFLVTVRHLPPSDFMHLHRSFPSHHM